MSMNREDILEKSRRQNQNKDPFEQQVIAEGSSKAYDIGILIACTLYAMEEFCNGTQNYSVLAVWTSMRSVLFIYKYMKLRRTHDLVFGIISGLCAVVGIALQILKFSGVMQ